MADGPLEDSDRAMAQIRGAWSMERHPGTNLDSFRSLDKSRCMGALHREDDCWITYVDICNLSTIGTL